MKRRLLLVVGVLTLGVLGSFSGAGRASVGASPDHEVWVTDQGTNQVHVLQPIGAAAAANLKLVHTFDFPAGSKPHMVLFGLHGKPGSRYAFVSNVGNGTATVIDAEARQVVKTLDTGTRTHAVQVSPDGKRALALALGPSPLPSACKTIPVPVPAPDCGQVVEILTDIDGGNFTLGRTFRITDAPVLLTLPAFNPVCGSFTPGSDFFYVTLSSGGLVVFKINPLPSAPLFTVEKVFLAGSGPGRVAANGCGIGYTVDGSQMFANSGTSSASYYYRFDIATHTMIGGMGTLISPLVGDVHGMMLSPDGKDVIMAGRLSDNFIVLDQETGAIKRYFSSLPKADAPDLTDFSPDGKLVYVTTRGPNPATGTHTIAGENPGVAVIDFASGTVRRVINFPKDPKKQDPHGLAVRRLAP